MTSASWSIALQRLDGAQALAAIDALTDVLIDCVEGGASVSFMLPLTRERAAAFWRKVAESVARGERALLVARRRESSGTADAYGTANDGDIVGTVQLILDLPENQPHRADVAKMLVHRSARRRGVAQQLMAALDEVARDEGRHVLVLDTVTGGDAERLYQRSGWQRAGDVPKFARMPDGAFCSTTFYYKHL
ncbi:GNAT family N-acetyltransferase [Pandoraea apista]|uniref:GNAT family N-acetyltransferase n=1 Tax=Pandoraea apista TaxID=93218 RepID=A0ABX9ZJ67_9BURK|nr:GNAT family N-acetyltransferase [Pandoraea apista]AJE97294.1 acetyltransferase [Pandoraea apista]AKH71260.1 acetyltransferase [Pandoraea apista]AKI63532.1 acetyltransferase [Pandoraea apista]PTD99336.1 N-acetyltransferase [Pandoraea apista]RRJ29366.1 GNAT family N-acetyltransferase [Pandoraea apista]